MRYKLHGRSGLSASELCLGTILVGLQYVHGAFQLIDRTG
jgi:aryl-alcohol dehydrogenase-like predicted oxidoreductase